MSIRHIAYPTPVECQQKRKKEEEKQQQLRNFFNYFKCTATKKKEKLSSSLYTERNYRINKNS